jgi:hypothetical protein
MRLGALESRSEGSGRRDIMLKEKIRLGVVKTP